MKTEKVLEQHYDLILIGSGMGSLTVASLMAQLRNKRVLVLERHFKAGGFTHDFKRKNFLSMGCRCSLHWGNGRRSLGTRTYGFDHWWQSSVDTLT